MTAGGPSLVLHIPMWERTNYFKISMASLAVALSDLRAHDRGAWDSIAIFCVDDSKVKQPRLFRDHLMQALRRSNRRGQRSVPTHLYVAKQRKEAVDTHLYGSVLHAARLWPEAWILNCETDHVFHPAILRRALEAMALAERRPDVWLVNLYNEYTDHHQSSTRSVLFVNGQKYYRRSIAIGASLMIAPALLKVLNDTQNRLPRGWGWDWFLSRMVEDRGHQIICSHRSWSQHIGLGGSNSRRGVPSQGANFRD